MRGPLGWYDACPPGRRRHWGVKALLQKTSAVRSLNQLPAWAREQFGALESHRKSKFRCGDGEEHVEGEEVLHEAAKLHELHVTFLHAKRVSQRGDAKRRSGKSAPQAGRSPIDTCKGRRGRRTDGGGRVPVIQ